tara:strand:+ start:2022 stop:2369 length:348 start_codon:yes stop_codon:yes gene_type:complete
MEKYTMMKYIRIFLDWIKALFLDTYDELHRPVVRPTWVVLLPYVVVVMATLVVVVEAVTDVTDVTPDVPVIPVITSTTSLDEDQALALDADLCSGRPRQFVLNLDGTQIKLSIQE